MAFRFYSTRVALFVFTSLFLGASAYASELAPADSEEIQLANATDDAVATDWSRIFLASVPSVDGKGEKFVFEWDDQIWLADVKGGDAKRIAASSGADSWPVMSADGKKVIFGSDRDGGFKVFEFDVEKNCVRQITFHSETTYPRAWTSDGKRIICTARRDFSGPKMAERLFFVRTDERAAEKLLFDLPANDPSVSPDGKYVLFTRRGDDVYRKRRNSTTPDAGEIWRYNIEDDSFDAMVTHETDCRNPIWMPDGSGFYYLDAKGGVRNVWRCNLKNREKKQITFFKDNHVFQPTLSADGKTMIFRQKFDFWRINPTKSSPRPERIVLYPEPGYAVRAENRRRLYNLCWNNDATGDVSFCDNGMQIAFTTGGDLYVMDTVIREPTLVHGNSATHERECVFAPDGKALYYLSDRGDTTDVLKAEPADPSKPWWENDAFTITPVVTSGGKRESLSISPNGERLAWQDPNGIFTFSETNGTTISRGPNAIGGGSYAWSPNGNWVVAQLADAFLNHDVWIISVDGKTAPYNLSRNFKYDGEPAWSPDGKIISFVSERPEFGSGKFLRYVYLNRALEEAETYEIEIDKSRRTIRDNAVDPTRYATLELPGEHATQSAMQGGIEFDGLAERVRTVRTPAAMPFFSYDSRTLAFANATGGTDFVQLPNNLKPQLLHKVSGVPRAWIRKDNRILWVVNNLPAIGERTINFNVYQNTNYRDYQELGFRTAWSRIRDMYYDPATHGVPWLETGYRYLAPARNAPGYSIFVRVMNMLLGELDSSHLGFYANENSNKEWAKKAPSVGWREQTAHLGLRFNDAYKGEGWQVKDVIPGGPTDRLGLGIKPGDIVTAIDGVALTSDTDPTLVLNGPPSRKVRLTYTRTSDNAKETVVIPSVSFEDARRNIGKEELRAKRRSVHEKSNERFGYLHIDEMNQESLWLFQHEVFSEGYGREGLVIDVRNNYGGFTADQMLQILTGADHSRSVTRTCGPGYLFGYWGRPVWSKPIVVLCNEKTGSNGEIFAHAIKTLSRGKLVGRETAGGVIATTESTILDLGSFRDAKYGWFLLDGTDMEHHGAKPDVEVDDLPSDVNRGIDRQLEKAIEVLDGEVKIWEKENPPINFKYVK